MSCHKMMEQISLFIDGELGTDAPIKEVGSAQRDELFKHLAACADCSSYFEAMLRLRQIQLTERITVPQELDRAVYRMARRSAPRSKAVVWGKPVSLPLPLAVAAVLLIIVLGVIAGSMLRSAERKAESRQATVLAHRQEREMIPVYRLPAIEVLGKAAAPSPEQADTIQMKTPTNGGRQ